MGSRKLYSTNQPYMILILCYSENLTRYTHTHGRIMPCINCDEMFSSTIIYVLVLRENVSRHIFWVVETKFKASGRKCTHTPTLDALLDIFLSIIMPNVIRCEYYTYRYLCIQRHNSYLSSKVRSRSHRKHWSRAYETTKTCFNQNFLYCLMLACNKENFNQNMLSYLP